MSDLGARQVDILLMRQSLDEAISYVTVHLREAKASESIHSINLWQGALDELKRRKALEEKGRFKGDGDDF